MPRRDYCDRCGVDVTDKPSGAVTGIADADSEGSGDVTDSFDILCVRCYTAIMNFIRNKERKR